MLNYTEVYFLKFLHQHNSSSGNVTSSQWLDTVLHLMASLKK